MGGAACACTCRAASGRRGMQRSVRLPGRHDPLACRRRIRRRERCRLRPARCMVPPLGGTVSAWQSPGGRGVGVPAAGLLPGGHGAANRRHCTAALLGGSKWGGRSTRRMAGAKDAEWRPFIARPIVRAGLRPAIAGRRAVRRNSAGRHAGRAVRRQWPPGVWAGCIGSRSVVWDVMRDLCTVVRGKGRGAGRG